MTLKNLLEYFEKYYNEKYSGVFLDTMTNYLSGKNAAYYTVVAEVMVKRFSRIYNKVPGVAEIESHREEITSELSWKAPKSLPETSEISTEEVNENLSLVDELMERLKSKTYSLKLGKQG